MIISVRGTNGSGKSTVVLNLMERAQTCTPLYGLLGLRKPEAYRLTFGGGDVLYVLGPYVKASRQLGMDERRLCVDFGVKLTLIRKYASKGHTIFEGMVESKIWGRLGALFEELAPTTGVCLLFLSTPVEVCVSRVQEWRSRAGDTEPFVERNLRAVFDQVRSSLIAVRQKRVPGLVVEEVSSDVAAARCLELLRGSHGR